jgi:long-chain acyl-CoA synthetase
VKELIYHRWFASAVEGRPGDLAFVDEACSYQATVGEHGVRVLRIADGMRRELGIGKGDRFAIMSWNSHRFIELYHAGLLGAGVPTPLNLRFAPRELIKVIRDAGARVVFVDAESAPRIEEIREEAGIERVVLLGDGDVPHDVRYEDILATGDPVMPPEPEESDPALLIFTGGTTGTPRGVVLSQRAQTLNGLHALRMVGARDVTLLHHPLFHAGTAYTVVTCLTTGQLTVIMPRFEPAALLETVERRSVEAAVLVVPMLRMVLDHPEYCPQRLASLRNLYYGAAPISPALLARVQDDLPGVRLTQLYGMTEASSVLTYLAPEDHGDERLLLSVGRPFPGIRLAIQDANGAVLPAGEVGEICAQGGNIMDRYLNRPEETAEALRGGWYHTGDAGYLDDQGFLFVVDRIKDMIVTGAENVYPAEVEAAISDHPAVQDVAVVGVPSEQWGEAVHAIIVVREHMDLTLEELRTHLRSRIAGYKLPKSADFQHEPLPLSAVGKVARRKLRDPHWEGKASSLI